jgi:Uma2 family endonuclease
MRMEIDSHGLFMSEDPMTRIPSAFDVAAPLGQEACLPTLHIEGDSQTGSDRAPSPAITYFAGPYGLNVTIPADARSWSGFRQWSLSADFPASGRFTFTPEELIADMSPERYDTHNVIKLVITSKLYERSVRQRSGRMFSDRFLLSNEAAQLSTEPDAMFVSHENLRTGRSSILPSQRASVAEELVGSPDWVLEVVSPSSRKKDQQLLMDAYLRAGVNEYWLVDALGERLSFQILVRRDTRFVPALEREGWLASPTFACEFQLTRVRDADGYWEYTLDARELDASSHT